jgi:zinc protease
MNFITTRIAGALALLTTFCPQLFAQNYDLKSFPPLDPKVKYGVLPNGMKYFIRANKLPEKRAEFYIAHNVGAILEDDNQNGLAHFTEHMAFNGTKNFPQKALLDYLATIGVKFGSNVNASTGVEQTTYMITSVPLLREGILDSALLVLHDWSGFISFEPNEIDAERGVIREEWRLHGSADMRISDKLQPIIYKDSKYAKRNVIGDTAVINHFEHETIKNFYKKWYRPDLQAIVVVGDFDADAVEAKVKKLFGDIPAAVNPTPKETYPLPDNVEPLIGIASDPEATSTEVSVCYKNEKVKDSDKNLGYMRLQLARSLMNSMFGQRMSEISRKENAPFLSASCYYSGYTRVKDAFIGYASARNNEGIKALNALLTEIERMKQHGFTKEELERVKANMLRSYESQYTDRGKRKNSEFINGNLSYFLNNNPNPGIEYMYEFVKNVLPGISLQEINDEAKKYVHPDNMIITVTGPQKDGITLPNEQEIKNTLSSVRNSKIEAYVDKLAGKKLIDKEPVPGKVVKVAANSAMETTEWTLSNGMRVIYKPTDFKEDEVIMSAYSIGGYSTVDNSTIPSAQCATSVVGEMGVGSFSRTDLSKMMAGKRVSVSPTISADREGFSGSMSPKDIETGLQLVYLYFTQPRWNETDFKIWMDKMKNSYINLQSNPEKAYSDTLTLMQNNHNKRFRPWTYQLLDEISFEKIKAFYKDRFCDPGDFTFIFAGKIDPDKVKPLIEKYLASLPTVKRKDVYKDDGVRPPKGKVVNDFARENKTPRTSVYVSYNGKWEYTPIDRMYMGTIRHILELRYTETIREEKGGSYSIGVSYSPKKLPEPSFNLTMSFSTDPKLADELKAIIYREVKKLIENGPTEADLQKAKEYFLKLRQEDLKGNSWWVNSTLIEYYYQNIDLLNGYENRIKDMTVKSVQDYAKKALSQGNIIEVVMRPL